MSAIRQFLSRVKTAGVKRSGAVVTVAMGRERTFSAWDVGPDTFVFEKGVAQHLDEHPSVLIVAKADLRRREPGYVLTISTGNHSVAAFPLLDGRFWKLSRLPSARRGDVLMHAILCANVVEGRIETSQRDVPCKKLYAADAWLLGSAGFALNDIVMGDRNEMTLDHYRRLGQEWRVKPLAWTETDMKTALAASRKRIASSLRYYHSARGVHFLSFSEFRRFADLASAQPEEFLKGLRELVSVFEGHRYSFTRLTKHRGHHEIELFGLRRGVALERLIPELEKLMESVVLGRLGQLGLVQKVQEILALFESLLTRPELADENSKPFVETLYMYVTGEIYAVVGEGSTPSFDDRRTALPGATFVDGRAQMQPGADHRSEVILSNLRALMSKDEVIEYANVYEIHDQDQDVPLGRGKTREIVYKTNRGPLEHSLVEKRLSRSARGYGSYMLARVEVFKALGVALSDYRLLRRRPHDGQRPVDYYIRSRCEGEPLEAIPKTYFNSTSDASVEERDVVLALAQLMGDAAAQNLAMKKFDPVTQSPLFGVGKEIYDFEYDIVNQRVIPKRVATCSVRGSFGWPDLSYTSENLDAIGNFYLSYYAHTLKAFQRQHQVSMQDVAERFMSGFEFRTHTLAWQLSVMRDRFETFDPGLPPAFGFGRKWRFAMWALDRQERRMPSLRRIFFEKVDLVEKGG